MKKHFVFITKFAFIFLLIAAQSFIISAQNVNSLKGRVTDANGAVVVRATVLLYSRETDLRLSVTTDANGEYRFERVANGDYIIEIAQDGFGRATQNVRVANPAQTVDFTLEVAAPRATVTVTASGTAQTVDETSKAVSSVNAAEVERRDELSLAEAVRTTPGLRVQQLGGIGAFTTIQTRGLRTSDTAVLVDGLRLRDAASTQGDASAFISDLFYISSDRVEVLRGSGSSLYGTNAIGGVVNVLSDTGGGKTRGEIQAEAGGLGLLRGRAKVSGGFAQNRFIYSGGASVLNVDKNVNRNPAHDRGAQGFAQYNFSPNITLAARFLGNTAYLALTDNPNNYLLPNFTSPPTGSIARAVPITLEQQRRLENGQALTNIGNANFLPDLRDPDNRRDSSFATIALIFNQRVNDKFGYRASYNRVNTNRQFSNGPAGVAGTFQPRFNSFSQFDGRIDTLNLSGDAKLGRFNLLNFGYEFENEKYIEHDFDQNSNVTNRVNAGLNIVQRSNTFFVQNQFRALSNRFQASIAYRRQSFDLRQPTFTGGASPYANLRFDAPRSANTGDGSISYFFNRTNTKIRAHIGSGYRAPSLYERFGSSFYSGAFSNYGDPTLAPERSIAVDGGIDQRFFNNRVQLSATYFYTKLQEVIFFDFTSNFANDPYKRFFGYRNSGGGLARGVELAANLRPYRSLDVAASYTFTNAQNNRDSSVQGFLRTFVQPRHIFTVAASQQIGRRVDVTFDAFAYSSYFFPFSGVAYKFDGPIKADLGGGYTHPVNEKISLRFYGKVENIFNRENFENGFRTPKAFFVGGTTLKF